MVYPSNRAHRPSPSPTPLLTHVLHAVPCWPRAASSLPVAEAQSAPLGSGSPFSPLGRDLSRGLRRRLRRRGDGRADGRLSRGSRDHERVVGGGGEQQQQQQADAEFLLQVSPRHHVGSVHAQDLVAFGRSDAAELGHLDVLIDRGQLVVLRGHLAVPLAADPGQRRAALGVVARRLALVRRGLHLVAHARDLGARRLDKGASRLHLRLLELELLPVPLHNAHGVLQVLQVPLY
mmetsp:Transcript_11758/g.20084  ORF Transcript_11758/g.20084 Transcript_11758/m.20084 type:complete len:234 (+) Transcript_11758:86-787(+)